MQQPAIAAYSGGALPAAIGIVRLSGENTGAILARLFQTKQGKPITERKSNTLYYGKLLDKQGKGMDLCLACYYSAPHSYTGEEMAEIFCHGSAAVVNAALAHAFALGARPAEAGEFTKRAFLNGKLDLMKAEAVADLIYAPSPRAAENAVMHLEGAVSGEISAMRRELVGLCAHFYAVCDYPEEEIDPFVCEKAGKRFREMSARLTELRGSYERGQALQQGLPVAVIGKPNAGKSTLFNALAGFERAIVTEEAGTTRDVIEHTVLCAGASIRLLDTAGLRRGASLAEKLGVERALNAAREAAAVLCVFDQSEEVSEEELDKLCSAAGDKPKAAVLNKSDLPAVTEPGTLERRFDRVFIVSALKKEGIGALVHWLSGLAPNEDQPVITSARQARLMEQASQDLAGAAESAETGMTADAFLSDVERAVRHLGEVTGEEVSPDIAKEIFSRFCVGK